MKDSKLIKSLVAAVAIVVPVVQHVRECTCRSLSLTGGAGALLEMQEFASLVDDVGHAVFSFP